MFFFAQILSSHLSPGAGFGGAGFIAGGIGTLYALKGHQSFVALGNQLAISIALLLGIPGIIGGVLVGLEKAPVDLWSTLLEIGVFAIVLLLAVRILQLALRPLRAWFS